jgi:hypothetical protein
MSLLRKFPSGVYFVVNFSSHRGVFDVRLLQAHLCVFTFTFLLFILLLQLRISDIKMFAC